MTIAAPAEQSLRYRNQSRATPGWCRLAVMASLMACDLTCFIVADLILHLVDSPPALALFRGRSIGSPNTIVDLLGIIAVTFVIVRYLIGDYSRRRLFWDGARAATTGLLVGGVIYVTAVLLLEPQGFLASLLVWLLLLFAVPGMRQVTRAGLSKLGLWRMPTAILGTSETAQEVYPVLNRQLALGLDVRWVVPENPDRIIPEAMAPLKPVTVSCEELVSALTALGCRQVVLVPDDRLQLPQNDLIDQLIGSEISVAIVPSLRRLPLFGLSTSSFFGKDLLLLQVRNNLARLPQRVLKRTIDIIGALTALVLIAPLFALLAIFIHREDRGPVFFVQTRVGRYGRNFRFWKFRTMHVDAEAQMARWAQENPALLTSYRESNFKLKRDPRITRIGAWMRRTSLDELPQLFNVLIGEMSLVGPRPLIPRELADYGAAITLYERVRPGISGLWQISGRSHTTFAERVSYDEWYIKNWTVWYDLVIMLQTIWVLVRGVGAY